MLDVTNIKFYVTPNDKKFIEVSDITTFRYTMYRAVSIDLNSLQL